MNTLDLDALALEYQGDYGTAHGNLDISDFVNNPFINCEASVLSLSLAEQVSDVILIGHGDHYRDLTGARHRLAPCCAVPSAW